MVHNETSHVLPTSLRSTFPRAIRLTRAPPEEMTRGAPPARVPRRRGRRVLRGRADGEPREGRLLRHRRARRRRGTRAVRSRPARPSSSRRDAAPVVGHRRLPGNPGQLDVPIINGDRQSRPSSTPSSASRSVPNDYVAKPYRVHELVSRMRAVLRRAPAAHAGTNLGSKPPGAPPTGATPHYGSAERDATDGVERAASMKHWAGEVTERDGERVPSGRLSTGRDPSIGNVVLDLGRHECIVRDEGDKLPLKEFELLEMLLEQPRASRYARHIGSIGSGAWTTWGTPRRSTCISSG